MNRFCGFVKYTCEYGIMVAWQVEITCRVIFLKISEKTFRKTIDNVGGSVRVRVR